MSKPSNFIKIDEIIDILENVNKIMKTNDNAYCLSESIQHYVYALQEFFKANISLEEVKQAYMDEATDAYCVRCNEFLGETNYEYTDRAHEWICRDCVKKEVKV